jgi:hypothetical protein
MTYHITGLNYADFAPLFDLDDAALAARGAMRVRATADRGFPCRVRLDDAKAGEDLILLQHVSHDVVTPYRSAYAIYVGKDTQAPLPFVDRLPPVFAGRSLSMRGFSPEGMLQDARLAPPGTADEAIRALFENPAIAYIDVHNAAHGCFVAHVIRDDEVGR